MATHPVNESNRHEASSALLSLRAGDVLSDDDVARIQSLVAYASTGAQPGGDHHMTEVDLQDAEVSRIEGFTPGSSD